MSHLSELLKKRAVLFEQSLQVSPNNVDAMTELAFAYLGMSDIDSARRWLDAALDREPRGIDPLTLMALLELSVGAIDQSIEHCERVQEIVPHHQQCSHLLGVNNLIAGNNEEAERWFMRAEPGNWSRDLEKLDIFRKLPTATTSFSSGNSGTRR